MDFLFGSDAFGVRFVIAFIAVLGLIVGAAFLMRRFSSGGVGSSSSRGRQPRLAVIDAAAVDGRRRLILIRRDNVEHLLMIGGPSDVVVEANIVRAAQQGARDAAGQRPPEALPRAVSANEGGMWPLQPEPAHAPAHAPAPAPRPPRQQPVAMEDPPPWHHEPEAPPPPRRPEPRPEPRIDMRTEPRMEPRPEPRPADPLAGLAAELSRAQPEAPAPRPRPQPREREVARARAPQTERMRPPPPPPPTPMDETTPANADQNLAEMAQRLEAALRRPKAPEPRASEAIPKPSPMTAPVSEPVIPMADPVSPPTPMVTAANEDVPPPARPAAAAKTQKSVYDSLEQEMASLLGRPNSKA